MAITPKEKYLRLKEKLKDPIFYAEFRKKQLERQRRYARNPEYCKKRALSTADWRWRKLRGLPTRQRNKIKPTVPSIIQGAEPNQSFEFTLIKDIKVSFD